MRSTTLLVLLVLLSGCSGSKDPDATAHDDSLLGDDSANETAPEISALPRLAVLGVDLMNGTAPLNVTFALGSEGPEAVAWDLDFGDGTGPSNGVSLPANVTHTYASNGTFAANLTIHYADGGTSNASQVIVVAAGGPVPGSFLRVEMYDKTETVLVGAQTTACGQGVNAGSDTVWEFPAAGADGIPNVVTHIEITMTGTGPGAVDVDIQLRGPDGVIGSGTSSGPNEKIVVDGLFPPGAYTVDVDGCVAVNASVTVHGEATFVVA